MRQGRTSLAGVADDDDAGDVRRLDRLSADDRLMLWSDPLWPQDVGAVAVLDGSTLLDATGRFRLDAVREAVERRLPLVPRLRQVLQEPSRGLGWPLWVDAADFDLIDHVRVARVPEPGDEAQFLRVVERLRRRRLDRSRPLWEMWFLPGLSGERVGLFIRLHHVVADGIAGVARLTSLMDAGPAPVPGPVRPWVPAAPPSGRELFADNVRRRAGELAHAGHALRHPTASVQQVRAGWPALRELLAEEPGPPTSLNRLVGRGRTLALVRGSLEVVQEVAHAHAATVNDVLLAMTAGGLRGLLTSRGERVDDLTLPVYVPVSLRRDRSDPGLGNLISQMVVPLPLGDCDPGLRLGRIAAETARRKALLRPSLASVFRSRAASGVMLKRIAARRVNVETADLRGPPRTLTFVGARLLEVFPLLNLIGNVSVGVGALSYAGRFNVLVVADAEAHPDLDLLAAHARAELDRLSEETRAGARAR